MFNKKILKWQIVAIIFGIAFGTLLHFTYKWSGQNKLIGVFSSVNESTWEHLKLSFFPIVIFGLIQYFFIGYKTNNYIEAKSIAAITSIIITTILFYTYTGIIGQNYLTIDILIFVISIIISEFIAYKIMNTDNFSNPITKTVSLVVIAIMIILFGIFTKNPPNINYFKEPQ